MASPSTLFDAPIAALDIGSAKVICLIADLSGDVPRVLGTSLRAMRGMKDGVIIDKTAASEAITAAVDLAERTSGVTVEHAIVSMGGGMPTGHVVEMDMDMDGHAVRLEDVATITARARASVEQAGRSILHALPAGFALEGPYSATPPIGMVGQTLSVAMHVVTAQNGPLQNLRAAVADAHLNPVAQVLSPLASGLGAVTDDEARMGVAVVDFGGGSRDISIFVQGGLVHAEILPGGGEAVSERVARALYTSLSAAASLQAHGSAVYDPSDERSFIDVPNVVDDGSEQRMPRSALTKVMELVLREQLAEVRARLEEAGFVGEAGRNVVLTGGMAQVDGIADLAADVLERRIRVARPQPVAGMPELADQPAYVGAVGLLRFAHRYPEALDLDPRKSGYGRDEGSKVGRLFKWLKANV